MTKLAILVMSILLSVPSPGWAGQGPAAATWILEKRIQEQLAGRVSLPRYRSLAPQSGPAQPQPEAVTDGRAFEPGRHYISVLPSYYIGVRRHTLSTAECALRGASMGAGYGLLIGALGTTTGLFEEDEAYYIIGAMSILGALMGGSLGPESGSFRSEWRWEAARRQFDWREEHKRFNSEDSKF